MRAFTPSMISTHVYKRDGSVRLSHGQLIFCSRIPRTHRRPGVAQRPGLRQCMLSCLKFCVKVFTVHQISGQCNARKKPPKRNNF